MADIKRLVRENVIRLTPYSCARDEFQGSSGIFMDANENPYGNLNRYPDPYQKELKASVSKFKGIEEEKIFLGNGSDEIIDLCFRIFCNPGTTAHSPSLLPMVCTKCLHPSMMLKLLRSR